jgi:hypothetical protein
MTVIIGLGKDPNLTVQIHCNDRTVFHFYIQAKNKTDFFSQKKHSISIFFCSKIKPLLFKLNVARKYRKNSCVQIQSFFRFFNFFLRNKWKKWSNNVKITHETRIGRRTSPKYSKQPDLISLSIFFRHRDHGNHFFLIASRDARFLLVQHTKTGKMYIKWPMLQTKWP